MYEYRPKKFMGYRCRIIACFSQRNAEYFEIINDEKPKSRKCKILLKEL